MEDREKKNQIPCIIDSGVVCNYRDMQRLLRDLGHVEYVELTDGEIKAKGEGYIVSVVSNGYSATMIANKRIYLNVNGFEYLRLGNDTNKPIFDLVDHYRTLRLIPLTDPIAECLALEEQSAEPVAKLIEDVFDEEAFAEINLDDDDSEGGEE